MLILKKFLRDVPAVLGLLIISVVCFLAVFAPLAWKLIRAGRLADEGVQWAAAMELRRAGLLVSDRPLLNAEAEEPPDER